MNPNDPNFDPGGRKDRVDLRDYQYEEVAGSVPPFDWSKPYDVEIELGIKLPVKDQGNSYSCGGQAWSTYDSVLEYLLTGTFEERSAKYIYSQVYATGGGSTGRDCANICVNQGVAREAILTSYEQGRAPSESFMQRSRDITADIRLDATKSKLYSYAQVGCDIEKIAIAVKLNHGVILGVDGSNNGTWLSEFPKPPKGGETIWRHWVYAGKVKTINGVKYIGILNSWGYRTGAQGWQWLSEEYFKQHVWSAWSHVIVLPLPPPAVHHNFKFDLEPGNNSTEVKSLQQVLQIEGVFPKNVAPTGFYGSITEQAVRDFQRKYGILSSGAPQTTGFGRVGPLTRAKLNILFA